MKIDTSTTAGKIEVMQAFVDGQTVERNCNGGRSDIWWDVTADNPKWEWSKADYKIKPQTVEEAAVEFYQLSTHNYGEGTVNSFKAGAEWQKEQDQ